ncbi:Zn finger-containing GTPase- Activating Protein for ARF [Dimargaris xerosporica]|nr:Zn finger-containing GTPase- Activating Protein for ARF [Dimargaris xerosporica]
MSDEAKKLIADLARQEGNKVRWGDDPARQPLRRHLAHTRFVRSVTMDRWTMDQAKRMQLGGNKKALEFFRAHPDYAEGMAITNKYNSDFAEQWRQKLNAACEGRSYTPSLAPKKTAVQSGIHKSQSSPGQQFGQPTTTTTPSLTAGNQGSFGSITAKFGSTPAPAAHQNQKARNEQYFAGLGAANQSRPEDLPPSQGGRYVGFGNTPTPAAGPGQDSSFSAQDLLNDPSQLLHKGWSLFSSSAQIALEMAGTVGDKLVHHVVQPTAEAIQDPNFKENVRGYVTDLGQRGAGLVSSVWNQPASTSFQGYRSLNDEYGAGRTPLASSPHEGSDVGGGQRSADDWSPLAPSTELLHSSQADRPSFNRSKSSTARFGTQKSGPTNSGGLTSRYKNSNSSTSLSAKHKPKSDWNDDWDEF